MANSATHGGLPFPVRGARFSLLVPYLDNTGSPTDPTTPDTEVSKDAGAFADCAEEVTTITGSNGMGYITLTGAEMDAAMVGVAAKVASGPKTTLATLCPRTLPVLQSGTAQAGASATLTLSTAAVAVDNYYVGCILKTTDGTGGGGTGGANNQARVITGYVGSTKVATVTPNWETTPSTDTTYEVLLTENALARMSDLRLWKGSVPANLTDTDKVSVSVQHMADGILTAAKIASDAITAAKIASDAITSAKIATDAIGAAQIAADAIGSSELAAAAATEIADAVWAATTRVLTANTNLNDLSAAGVRNAVGLASANLDTQLGAIAGYIDTEVGAIKAKTDNLPADPADQSDVEAAITAAQVAILAKVLAYFQLALRKDAAITTDNATELGELNADEGSGAGAYAATTDSQEAIRDNQQAASAAALAAYDPPTKAELDAAQASIEADIGGVQTTADAIEVDTQDLQAQIGTAGAGLTDLGGMSTGMKAEVNAEADQALADYDAPTKAELDAAVAPLALEATAQDILTDTGTTLPATLSTIAGYIDTEIGTILSNLATVDGVVDAIKLVTDKLAGLTLVAGTIGSTGNDTTHLQLAGLTYGNDELNGHFLAVLDVSTGEIHVREITDWVLSTELATVATLPFTPEDGVDSYWVLAATASAGGPSAAQIADAVWEEPIADHNGTSGSTAEALGAAGSAGDPWATALPGAYGVGSAGNILGNRLDAAVSSRATQTSVDDLPTNAELAAALADADDAVLAAIAGLNDPSAATVAAAVWDAVQSSHVTAGSFGEIASEIASVLADTAELQGDWANGGRLDLLLDAIKAVTDALPEGGALTTLLANVAAILVDTGTTLDGKIDAIKAKTDNLPTDPADQSLIIDATNAIAALLGSPAGASVSADIAAAKAVVDAVLADTGTDLPAALATIDSVVDAILAMLDDPRTEPGQGAPPATVDLATKVDYLYKLARNKRTQTETELTIFADDGTTADHKATVNDDGTTLTVGELGTGA